ncbi:hypothetical protein [Desulfobulbus propionicus]
MIAFNITAGIVLTGRNKSNFLAKKLTRWSGKAGAAVDERTPELAFLRIMGGRI